MARRPVTRSNKRMSQAPEQTPEDNEEEAAAPTMNVSDSSPDLLESLEGISKKLAKMSDTKKIETLVAMLKEKKEELDSVRKQLKLANRSLKRKESRIASLNQEVSEYDESLQAQKNSVKKAAKSASRNTNAQVESAVEQAKEEFKLKLKDKNDMLKKSREKAREFEDSAKKLRAENKEIKGKLGTVQKELKESEKDLFYWKKEARKHEKKINDSADRRLRSQEERKKMDLEKHKMMVQKEETRKEAKLEAIDRTFQRKQELEAQRRKSRLDNQLMKVQQQNATRQNNIESASHRIHHVSNRFYKKNGQFTLESEDELEDDPEADLERKANRVIGNAIDILALQKNRRKKKRRQISLTQMGAVGYEKARSATGRAKFKQMAQAATAAITPLSKCGQPIPTGWVEIEDEYSCLPYYENVETGRVAPTYNDMFKKAPKRQCSAPASTQLSRAVSQLPRAAVQLSSSMVAWCPSPVDLEPEFALSEPQPVMPPTLSGMKRGQTLENPVDLLSGAESCGNNEHITDKNGSKTAKTGKKYNGKENKNGDDEQEEGKNCNDEKDANNEETEDEDDQNSEAITVESMDSNGDFIQSENLLIETEPEDEHYKDEGQESEEYKWEG